MYISDKKTSGKNNTNKDIIVKNANTTNDNTAADTLLVGIH